MKRLELPDEAATQALGRQLAAVLDGIARAHGCIVYLRGDLGAGKTTLVRALLRGLGHEGPVRSPTYTLLEPYELDGRHLLHLDLYRLADPEELEYMGLRDYLEGNGVLLVEWPEQGRGLLPAADLDLRLDYRPSGRQARLDAGSALGERMLAALDGQEDIRPVS